MDLDRLAAIVARITADPACWNQEHWHCGTAHCLAGHAQIDAGKGVKTCTTEADAVAWLGLTQAEAYYLFDANRTLADFGTVVTQGFVFDSAGFDPQGYDHCGPYLWGGRARLGRVESL